MKAIIFFAGILCLAIGGFIMGMSVSETLVTDDLPVIIRKINVDDRGLISVAYTEDGKRKALDYLTREEFKIRFGIDITNY